METSTTVDNFNIKEELEELAFDPFEDEEPKVPVKTEVKIKTEINESWYDEETNFLLSNESFENCHIKKEDLEQLSSPVKTELESSDSNSRKSLKSTKFSLYKKRDSPYKSVRDRLGVSANMCRVSNLDLDEGRRSPAK